MKSIWKSKRFLIGFIYLTVFIIASFVYSCSHWQYDIFIYKRSKAVFFSIKQTICMK